MSCDHQQVVRIKKYGQTNLYRCNSCKLVFRNQNDADYHPQNLYDDYYKNEIVGRFFFGIEYIVRFFRFWRALKIYTIYPKAKYILDIGSGRGFMLYFLKKYFHYQRTVGTQISRPTLEFSKNKLGLEIYGSDLLQLSWAEESFDIVTIWHVLEHVVDPESYLKKIHTILTEDGKLIIEVPNFNSWTRKLTGKYWLGLDLDYHLYFFTPISLSVMLKKHGFKIIKTHTFSLEYSTFISTQSLISFFTKTNHIFFQSLQRHKFNLGLVWHLILFMVLAPPCFVINILLYFSRRGEVLLLIAQKI